MRKKALELINTHIANENLKKHLYAVEAVMIALADHFKADNPDEGRLLAYSMILIGNLPQKIFHGIV